MKPPIYKRHYFLPDSCQPRMMTMSLAQQGLAFLAFSAALFIPLALQLQRPPQGSVEAAQAATDFLALHESVWPLFPVALLAVGIHALFAWHRIAGPLYRFRRIFAAVAEGDLTVSAKIRRSDYLQPEAARLGEMVSTLREKVGELDRRAEQSRQATQALRRAVTVGSTQDVMAALAVLDDANECIAKSLQHFTLAPSVPETRR